MVKSKSNNMHLEVNNDLELDISFSLTLTNLVALELITGLSLFSQVYSLGYMDKEWALARFFALLGFFEGAMSGVVLSGVFSRT